MTRRPQLHFKIWVVVLLAIGTLPVNANEEVGAVDASEPTWPWTKLVEPEVPQVWNKEWSEHPIDAFVLKKLEEQGLQSASSASPRALLRRVQFGLVGLPPDPQEMRKFLQDPSPQEYRRRINQLLDDDSYGERWARHWLDLVRYADTQGGALDYSRPHMWRYRDYVIRAFNQDRPYDRFVREQIAADAFPQYGDEGKIGLALLHQWVPVERTVPQLNRRDFLEDVVGVTGSVFMGVTLSCARCHDHKYDPIPTSDYYRIEAFFAPLEVSAKSLPFTEFEVARQDPKRWEQKLQVWKDLMEKRKKWQDETFAEYKERLRKLRKLPATADLKDAAPRVGYGELSTAVSEGIFFNEDEVAAFQLILRQTARFVNPNHEAYFEPKAYQAQDSSFHYVIATHVLSGGNFRLKEDSVEPGYFSAITGNSEPVNLEGLVGSPRKLLASWISAPDNPLTARVMVNRIWQYHFGRGLVATSSDFGINGSGTVHAELIDWLAVQFIRSGWSIKEMHRLILTSKVYQQSMSHPMAEQFEQIDPANQYLWVRDPIRLEAEVIRDSVLAVSGQLNSEMGGPPFFPEVDDELMRRAPTWWEPSAVDQRHRRTIYMLQIRSLQNPLIKVFDGANMDKSCPVRGVTSVTPQVFALFNSKFLREQSQAMATSLQDAYEADVAGQVRQVYQSVMQRDPSEMELKWCTAFLQREAVESDAEQQAGVSANRSQGPAGTLTDLCLVLLNSNEFLFLE